LACLHPAPRDPNRMYHYQKYEHTLNTDRLKFPLPTKDIPRFEAQNPTVSINVLSLGEKDFCIEYCSPERQRPHHVNLLLLNNDDGRRHYIWIKDMSRLVPHKTHHDKRTYVCNGCLHPFTVKHVLDHHFPNCTRNPPQAVKYPDPEDIDDCTAKFKAHKNNSNIHSI